MELNEDPSLSQVDNWYYFVFNFGTLNPSDATRPLDQIAGAQRGRNWEMYVAFNRNRESGDTQAITDRRDRLPTILPTADGPVDAAIGSFNPDEDEASDILVAARDGDAIQLFRGKTENIRDNIYYEEVETINTGDQPLRIFSSSPDIGSFPSSFATASNITTLDLDTDGNQDAVVIFGGGGSAFIRPLFGNGDGTFTAGADVPLAGIPVDAIFADLDTPGTAGTPDLAILTVDSAGGAGTVRVFTGGTGGTFTAGSTVSVGEDPVQIAGGLIDAGNDIDIAVANAGDDSIDVFFGAADAGFAAETTLSSPGELQGVTINTFFGTGGDVAFSFDDAGTGNVGVFLREVEGAFAEAAVTRDIERPAGPLLSFDAGGDQRIDVLNLDRASSGGDGNLVIARSERVTPEGGGTPEFGWAEFPVTYSTGTLPTRMVPVDFEADNDLDLIVPNSGAGDNGNSIGVHIALGRYQYSDVNIYWTDGDLTGVPDLTTQPWYLGHSFAGKRITLTIDATQLLSLAEMPPEELLRGQSSRNYFIIDMMTTDAPIDTLNRELLGLQNDPDFGVVTEHFTRPVIVPMNIAHLDNQATTDVVAFPAAPPERDIVDWQIEAN